MENWYKKARNATFVNQLGDSIDEVLKGKYRGNPQHEHLRVNDIFDVLQDLMGMGFSGISKDPATRARLFNLMKQRGQKTDADLLTQICGTIRSADKVQEAFLS